jgi:hypothetical protein
MSRSIASSAISERGRGKRVCETCDSLGVGGIRKREAQDAISQSRRQSLVIRMTCSQSYSFLRAASQSQNECESCKQVPGYWLHTNSSGALLVTERR